MQNDRAELAATDTTTAAVLEFSCASCTHTQEAHDVIGIRYCAATLARGLDRRCVCAHDADNEKTYYRR